MRSCRFGVIRRGDGSATVRVFWPDGGERYLYFENGKVNSSDARSGAIITTERVGDLYFADGEFTTRGDADLDYKRESDNWLVTADGREHYKISDAVIVGD